MLILKPKKLNIRTLNRIQNSEINDKQSSRNRRSILAVELGRRVQEAVALRKLLIIKVDRFDQTFRAYEVDIKDWYSKRMKPTV